MPAQQITDDFSDTPSISDQGDTSKAQMSDGGSILPKDTDAKKGTSEKADTPEEPALSKSELENLRLENEKLRKGQSTLEKRLGTVRQLLQNRQESAPTQSQPELYEDGEGRLYTKDPTTGQMMLYQDAPQGDDFDEKDTKLAEYELKEEVRGVLDEYPNLSKAERDRLLSNPFRWWMYQYPEKSPEKIGVDEVLLDIEYKLMDLNQDGTGQTDSDSANKTANQGFRVAPSNATPQIDLSGSPLQDYITEEGTYDIEAIDKAITDGDLSLKDLEKVIKNTPLKSVSPDPSRGMFKRMS